MVSKEVSKEMFGRYSWKEFKIKFTIDTASI